MQQFKQMDFKTTADFCKDNGPAIRATCRRFVMLCRQLALSSEAIVAIDGSKFKAVNNRDKNFTPNKIQRRMGRSRPASPCGVRTLLDRVAEDQNSMRAAARDSAALPVCNLWLVDKSQDCAEGCISRTTAWDCRPTNVPCAGLAGLPSPQTATGNG
jgi:hypothetical protein